MPLIIPCETGKVSDGYHTFDELYNHRCHLFAALMLSYPIISWKSKLHADGSGYDGWFIVGMDLPTGTVTYHFPNDMWESLPSEMIQVRDRAPAWDGHTPDDVICRIMEWKLR